jgi:outer membrane receptor protein involved in Fe transport
VTLTNKSTHRIVETSSGAYGDYTVRDIPPGQYSILVTLPGFTGTEFPNLAILVAQNLRLDARMKPGATSTVVQVTDSAPLMDTQSSTSVTHVTQDELDSLPKGRAFEQLANLAPGINTGEIQGGIQINGASGAENTYLIDGVATQSAIDGRQRQSTVFDNVQEIQVQTAGLDASYSGATGGIISAVTRSGGDQLQGSAWFYYSGNSLTSAPPKRLVLNPLDNRSVSYVQIKPIPTAESNRDSC